MSKSDDNPAAAAAGLGCLGCLMTLFVGGIFFAITAGTLGGVFIVLRAFGIL